MKNGKRTILFLLEDYNLFYTEETKKLLQENSNLSYSQILYRLKAKKYYQSDSMAVAFDELGYETHLVIPEANPLQLTWAKENKFSIYLKWLIERPVRSFKSRVLKQYRNSYNSIQFYVLLEQVKKIKPEVIYFYSNIFITKKQIDILKKYGKKIVLQWSCPLWDEKKSFPYKDFDLITTAAIQLKQHFDNLGYPCFYLQQAFDKRITQSYQAKEYIGDVVFIGNFSLGHYYRFEVLEFLLKNGIDLTIYGKGKDYIPVHSMVYDKIKAPLFGLEMYHTYRKYKIAIHIHTTGKETDGFNWSQYAGAKRLFEITGAGAMLLTSFQENVQDLFEIDREVITYQSPQELLEKINYYLSHQTELEKIAERGMQRTLKDHSFNNRAKELEPILFPS